jgi:preprotein translocase subunit SecA
MATQTKMEVGFLEKLTDTLGALSEGLVGFIGRMFGSSNERYVRNLGYVRHRDGSYAVTPGSILDQVNALEPFMRAMTDATLKELTTQLKECLSGTFQPRRYKKTIVETERPAAASAEGDGEAETTPGLTDDPGYRLEVILPEEEANYTADGTGVEIIADPLDLANVRVPATLEDLMPFAFAACREAARRTKNMRDFDVQILGGVVLHRGNIAEMVTGEGKTLVATLPAYLNALDGQGVHIITVNDYLARRDCEWMLPIYNALGVSAGYIQSDMDPQLRQEAYRRDITYGTNSEFGFDYLRDNMKPARWDDEQYPYFHRQVQRTLNYAIIDEVDNILVDEARTPLIISGPAFGDLRRYARANEIAIQLSDLQKKDQAKYFEVKEKERTCHLTDEGIRKAEELAGVESFYTAGNMEWPHLIDNSLKANHLYHKDKQYVVMRHPETNEMSVIIVDEFTGRLMIGRQWSDGLHQAVEAKHAREGVKIKEETQTLATITLQNYFKLYKKLAGMTGTAMTEANEFWKIYKLEVIAIPTNKPLIRENFPDQIYLTEKEKWDAVVGEIERIHKWDVVRLNDGTEVVGTIRREVDGGYEILEKDNNQKRVIPKDQIEDIEFKGRPMLIGTTDVEKSEKLSAMLKRRGIKHELLNAKPEFAARESEIVAQAGRIGGVTIATNMAGRGTDIILGGNPETLAWARLKDKYPTRLDVPDEEWKRTVEEIRNAEKMEEEGRRVAGMGGLHIVGTERHEARRIDNQLRGRAGRQGDPGSGRFYLSLQDDLMRIFAGEWVAGVLQRLGMQEGQSIESRMVSRRIEAAQKKVEERNFDIRKNLLEYDEVMDHQRKRVYGYRQEVLEGANCKVRILKMIDNQVELALERFLAEDYGPASFAELAGQRLGVEFDAADFTGQDYEEAVKTAREKATRMIPTQIHEAMEENLSTDVDSAEWNWQAMAGTVHTRWGIKLSDRDLKKIGRDNLAEHLTGKAEAAVNEVDLSKGAPYLSPDWGRRSLCDWMMHKFQIKIDPAELTDESEEAVRARLQNEVRKLYHLKEIEFPVTVAMARFMSERGHSGPAGQRYDREGLYRWALFRYGKPVEEETHIQAGTSNGGGSENVMVVTAAPVQTMPARTLVHVGLTEDDFRTQSRAKLREALLDISRKTFPSAIQEEIDTKLEEAFSGADTAEEEDAREIADWAREQFALEIPVSELLGRSKDEAQDLLWNSFDDRYRPEMKRMERSLLLNQLDLSWKNHLYTMDHLRQGIGLVGYAQIDPKTEYKRQGMKEFEAMWEGVEDKVTDTVFRMEDDENAFQESLWAIGAVVHESAPRAMSSEGIRGEQDAALANQPSDKKPEPIRNRGQRVGRNEPCPCGSGKKYKNCCMRKGG